MFNDLYIFGTGAIAEVASYYFQNDTNYNLRGFINKREFIGESSFINKPIIEFNDFMEEYKRDQVHVFIAVGYLNNNQIRKDRYFEFEKLGFNFASYISSRAVILNNNRIGKNAFILEHNVIQPYVSVGDNCILWSGNHIGHHSRVDSHTFIASHVVISGKCEIGQNSFIGVNATIHDGVKVGESCVIGAGSIVRKNLPNKSIVRAPLSDIKEQN
jgi:sugar O-acyltransferase (sialic acid O-acetyltransferase NeuD family)